MTIIFRWSELASHEHMRPAKLHAAWGRFERREVDFLGLGRGDDTFDIARRDSPAWHHHNTAPCALNQFADQRQSFENGRLLARSEHAVDAKSDKRLERFERSARHVERPVECH